MKKIGLVTLYDNRNYGNKLQNYAIQILVKKMGFYIETIRIQNSQCNHFKFIFNRLKYYVKKILPHKLYKNINFKIFEKKFIKNTKKVYYSNEKNISLNSKFDLFIVGSDQVWNPTFGNKGCFKTLDFTNSKISFSASFGVGSIPDSEKEFFKKNLINFKMISVREDEGKKIVQECTERKDVEVLIDPTMLLTSHDWNQVIKKPKQINNIKLKKYILNYFLGDMSEEREKEINRIAKENKCEIINIMDKKDPFNVSGPSEFLWLEKNAYLICTDSFHSSVFAILFDRPFIVFEREGKEQKMSSRIDTLINKFKLENRRYNGKEITKENLEHDYTEAYKILDKERQKSKDFLEKAFDIK